VDTTTNRPKGFAFVTLDNRADAEEAVKNLNGTDIDGRQIRVEISTGERRAPRPRRDFDGGDRRRDYGDRPRRDYNGGGGGDRRRDDRGNSPRRRDDRRDRSRSREPDNHSRRDDRGGRGGDR
jgi:cold-inducible RNA-binding protein